MRPVDEEKLYDELRNLGKRLHVPIPEAFWEFEVRDKNGRVVQRLRQRSHSWVRNAYNHLFGNLAGKDLDNGNYGAGYLSVRDTNGYIRAGNGPGISDAGISWDGTSWGYRAPAGEDEWGILVGSGANPESFEDYILQTKINDGTGAGQLSHVQSEGHNVTWDAPNLTMKNELVRYFNNNSGASVDVNEVGLFPRGYIMGSSAPANYMFARDKLASTVTVPDTGQLKVTYTVQLTYPA